MNGSDGVWVHAVTRDLRTEHLAGLTGVADAQVRPLEVDGLVAVVSPVDLAEYGEQALRRNLEDLAWLERVAREHHRVAGALARFGPVVPARLATVHRDESGLRAELAQRSADLVAALDRVDGRSEWGVKAYAVTAAPATDVADPGASTMATAGAGRAYLQRRREQLAASESAERAATGAAEQVHAVLTRHAEAGRLYAPQDRGLSGVAEPMVLNGAYLVRKEAARDFPRLVEALAERHPAVRLELTGPWPPYSFAGVDDEGEAR